MTDKLDRYDQQYNSLLIEKKDVTSYLTKELERKSEEITQLKVDLKIANQFKANFKESSEMKLNEAKSVYDETTAALQNKILRQGAFKFD